MKRAKRPVVATALAISMTLGALMPLAAQARPMEDVAGARPGEIAMITDAVLARPLILGATVVGTAVYTVTLPFTLLGRNEDEAAEVLVKAPARSTFLRCLGCTPAQSAMNY